MLMSAIDSKYRSRIFVTAVSQQPDYSKRTPQNTQLRSSHSSSYKGTVMLQAFPNPSQDIQTDEIASNSVWIFVSTVLSQK